MSRRPGVTNQTADQLADRSGGWMGLSAMCEIGATEFCTGRGEQIHHRQGRVGPDAHHITALLFLCAPCHRHVHARPAKSRDAGWMVSRTGVASAADVAVLLHDGRRVLLTDAGGYGELSEPDVWEAASEECDRKAEKDAA